MTDSSLTARLFAMLAQVTTKGTCTIERDGRPIDPHLEAMLCVKVKADV